MKLTLVSVSFVKLGAIATVSASVVGCGAFLSHPRLMATIPESIAEAKTPALEKPFVPPIWWPVMPKIGEERRIAKDVRFFNDNYVADRIRISQGNLASTELKDTLVNLANTTHQPILASVKSRYGPRAIFQEEIKSAGFLDGANAVVVIRVRSNNPAESHFIDTRAEEYVYGLYKKDGKWKVISEYRLLLVQVTS